MSEKVQLQISGMSCAACVRRVEQGLADLKGVSSASVNFATQKATLDYDPAEVDIDQMAAKVEDLGYEVIGYDRFGEPSSQKTTVSDRRHDLRRLRAACGVGHLKRSRA